MPRPINSAPRSFCRRWLRRLSAGTLVLLAGCGIFPRATPTPIPTLTWKAMADRNASTLIVFLPGRGDTKEEFETRGFLAELRSAGIDADVTAVDAHLTYYLKRTVIRRLREDVIQPARAAGYRRIVIVGISLGGLGSLLGERETPGLADELVLIAPYLGERRSFFTQVAAAGGPLKWSAGRDVTSDEAKIDEIVWTFLGQRSPALPPIWLLYGTRDRFSQGQALFAEQLAPERVLTVDGGHDWNTWLSLWRRLCLQTDAFSAEKPGADRAL